MTIDAALATVTANNKAKTYGDVNRRWTRRCRRRDRRRGRSELLAVDDGDAVQRRRGQPLRNRGQLGANANYNVTPSRRRDDDRRGTGHGHCQQQGQDLR
jgi:hypothetical protein